MRTWWVLALLAVLPCAAARAERFPGRPAGSANFVVDEALLLDPQVETAVNEICRQLLAEKQVPIYVVTIPSLAFYDSSGPIESYAHALFGDWGIGSPERNLGILLLVARGDRKARIELGADWGRSHDGDALEIMQELIIPRFKRGEFGDGVVEGVRGLDRLARGQQAVSGGGPNWFRIGVVFSLLFLFIWILRRATQDAKRTARWTRRRPVADRHWRRRQEYRDRRDRIAYGVNSSSAGDWFGSTGGGGFGGGWSGGGGATGSW